MPYILSPIIKTDTPALWNEGVVYERASIYQIRDGALPPVNYDRHSFKPHSITHLETPAHTIKDGHRLEYYLNHHRELFYGACSVLKLAGDKFIPQKEGIKKWEVQPNEIMNAIAELPRVHNKIFIAPEVYPQNAFGYHHPDYIFVLSEASARLLVEEYNIRLFGTSWKSTDYQPGKRPRPIHEIIFSNGLILENLDLLNVPAGNYFLNAFPIMTQDTSETLVTPVLYTKDEILNSEI